MNSLKALKKAALFYVGRRYQRDVFFIPMPDVKLVRDSLGLSQKNFAQMLGISPSTLQSWEKGRKQPVGPARLLLQIAARHPEAIWDTIQKMT